MPGSCSGAFSCVVRSFLACFGASVFFSLSGGEGAYLCAVCLEFLPNYSYCSASERLCPLLLLYYVLSTTLIVSSMSYGCTFVVYSSNVLWFPRCVFWSFFCTRVVYSSSLLRFPSCVFWSCFCSRFVYSNTVIQFSEFPVRCYSVL